MAGGVVNVVLDWVTRVDEETILELHGLCTSSTEFAGNNDLATLGTGFHDEAQDTVACSDYTRRLVLGMCRKATNIKNRNL